MHGSRHTLAGADFVRAVACLGVLAHHLLQRIPQQVMPETLRPVHAYGLMGSFGVAAFFVLSGFLLARPFWLALEHDKPMPSLRVYALRRVARIAPAFWLALSVTFVLSFTLFNFRLDGALWLRFLAGFGFVSSFHWLTLFPVEFNGPLWSIGFEVASYALLPISLCGLFLIPHGRFRRLATLPIFAAIIGLVLVFHTIIRANVSLGGLGYGWDYGLTGGARVWMPDFNPVGFFAVFALGSLAAGVQVKVAHLRHWTFDLTGLAGFGLAIFSVLPYARFGQTDGLGWLGIPYGFPLFPIGIGLVLLSLPQSLIVGKMLDNPMSRYVAKVSFGVYLWHFLVIELIRANYVGQFFHGGMRDFAAWSWTALAVVTISFAIAHLSYRVLEAPLIAWARSNEQRRVGESVAV